MNEKTARDLCVPLHDYPHADVGQTLAEAVTLLDTVSITFKGNVSMPRVLLVFDDSQQLAGVVRRRDIMRGLEPKFHDELAASHPEAHVKTDVDPNLSDLVELDDRESLRRRLQRPIGDVLRQIPGQVDADDNLMRVVRELVGKDTHIAVVIDQGAVMGVVRTIDVLRAVTAGVI